MEVKLNTGSGEIKLAPCGNMQRNFRWRKHPSRNLSDVAERHFSNVQLLSEASLVLVISGDSLEFCSSTQNQVKAG
jgi:hypothetical protein